MDDADITADRLEQEIELARKEVASRKRVLQPTGFCHNCEEGVVNERLFCDSSCAADWERRNGK